MRIQATNTFYTGAYSVLNTKSSFPYAVKVEGYGNTRNQKSLFQFAHVTITEHMLNAKYGTKITNGPRVQMQTAGSKKKEDWAVVSKEQLAEVKLPSSFEKLKEQNSVEDIANWMMSGTPNRNIETRYLNYLHTVDPDLYNVAMRIGMEVRTYDFMEDLYSPDEAKSLDKLREQQYKHGGIV